METVSELLFIGLQMALALHSESSRKCQVVVNVPVYCEADDPRRSVLL